MRDLDPAIMVLKEPWIPPERCYICDSLNVSKCAGFKTTNIFAFDTEDVERIKNGCDTFLCSEHINICPYCQAEVCGACMDDHLYVRS